MDPSIGPEEMVDLLTRQMNLERDFLSLEERVRFLRSLLEHYEPDLPLLKGFRPLCEMAPAVPTKYRNVSPQTRCTVFYSRIFAGRGDQYLLDKKGNIVVAERDLRGGITNRCGTDEILIQDFSQVDKWRNVIQGLVDLFEKSAEEKAKQEARLSRSAAELSFIATRFR